MRLNIMNHCSVKVVVKWMAMAWWHTGQWNNDAWPWVYQAPPTPPILTQWSFVPHNANIYHSFLLIHFSANFTFSRPHTLQASVVLTSHAVCMILHFFSNLTNITEKFNHNVKNKTVFFRRVLKAPPVISGALAFLVLTFNCPTFNDNFGWSFKNPSKF